MLSIKKRSLVDMVYDKLRGAIIQLQLPLGSKLNVNELQDKIGPVAGGEAAAVEGGSSSAGLSGILAETLAALTSLGYSEQEVLPVAESHLAGCTTVEQLLKETLKALGSGR